MPCVTDLTHVSTNSLPSTLLKKTMGRKQVPFHDRIVPSSATKQQQRNDTDDDNDDELSSVSTQSTPLSLSQPSHAKHGSTNAATMIREVSLDGSKNRPIVAPHHLHGTSYSNNVTGQRPRRPSPERTMSYQNAAIIDDSKSKSTANHTTSASQIEKNKVTYHMDKDDFNELLSSTSNCASPVDFTNSVLQHPSLKRLSVSANKKSLVNTPKQSNHNNSTMHQAATDVSEVLGRTIPFSGSSVNVLCSNDEEDDDDRHRYIVSITTSRSTIKASGGRNQYPRMDDYVTAASPQQPMMHRSFSNYSTQLEEEDEFDEDEEVSDHIEEFQTTDPHEKNDVLHESNHTNDHNVSKSEGFTKLQKERENDIISAATSRRSGKLSSVAGSRGQSRECTTSAEAYGRNENQLQHEQRCSVSLSSKTPSYNSRNKCNGPFPAQVPMDNCNSQTSKEKNLTNGETTNFSTIIAKDETSQSKTLSSTRFVRSGIHDDDDMEEAQRENEILSAAASRKTGTSKHTGVRTHQSSSSNRSNREVLIEDHEKPTMGSTVQSTTAWRKIDDVLFGDDLSELHLFKKPTKDVFFDDLLTTTSDCSSISVSLDPSGCIVNDLHHPSSERTDQVRDVIKDVEFNRVKTVLDRMKKPTMVYGVTNNVGNITSRVGNSVAVRNVPPKTKNRIGTGNFVQNRFQNTHHEAAVRTAKQMEDARKKIQGRQKSSEPKIVHENFIPIVVQARSFHGDTTVQNLVTSVPVVEPSSLQRQTVVNTVSHHPNSLHLQNSIIYGPSGRKDPPANTLCSEKR